jgi:hypothetical protein
MNRLLALKISLGIIGVVFLLLLWPLEMMFRQEPAVAMMLSLYVTLGVFLLLAIRNPAAHRSLIAFTAWSSLAHAAVMTAQVLLGAVAHSEMIGNYVLAAIGVLLLALAPARADA